MSKPSSAPILVIGHRNPDTDSVASAIGYAWLLNTTGIKAEAAICGEINARTQLALTETGLPEPRMVMDVRPTVGQIARRDIPSCRLADPLFTVYHTLQRHHLRAIPVLNSDGQLVGLAPFAELMELLIPDPAASQDSRTVDTSLARLTQALGGSFLHAVNPEQDEELVVTVGAMGDEAFGRRMRDFPANRTLVVVGDRSSIHTQAIGYGVRGIVITGGYTLDPVLLDGARARGVSILLSPHDTATTTLLMRSAKHITPAVVSNFLRFHESHPAAEALREIAGNNQEVFPVVGGDGSLVGIFTKADLAELTRARPVLVDHNEYGQSVAGASEADIVEVIDHHRIGGSLTSREPIRFINEPVGSTSTLIARMIRERSLTPPTPIARLLAAGIIVDTLNLRSPTSTPVDETELQHLVCGHAIDTTEFATRLFAAGSVLGGRDPVEAVRSDLKEYIEHGWRFTVSQVEELDLARLGESRTGLEAALDRQLKEHALDFACLLVTNITRQTSVLILRGNERIAAVMDYPRGNHGLWLLAGVVSRKKQLLPHLSRILAKLPRN